MFHKTCLQHENQQVNCLIFTASRVDVLSIHMPFIVPHLPMYKLINNKNTDPSQFPYLGKKDHSQSRKAICPVDGELKAPRLHILGVQDPITSPYLQARAQDKILPLRTSTGERSNKKHPLRFRVTAVAFLHRDTSIQKSH